MEKFDACSWDANHGSWEEEDGDTATEVCGVELTEPRREHRSSFFPKPRREKNTYLSRFGATRRLFAAE